VTLLHAVGGGKNRHKFSPDSAPQQRLTGG
jgi:hypothetical protein